jgi:hypothetical protein
LRGRSLALLCLAWLGGCNAVVTKTPLFTAADEAGAPALKPGVWLVFKQADCKFDESKPIDEWPDCAGGAVSRPGEVISHDAKAAKGVWQHDPMVLAAGDPRIAQVPVKTNVSAQADASASGGATASASASGGGETRVYGYAGVAPTSSDSEGRITGLEWWPVQCGPPPPKNDKGEITVFGTLKPLPGMVMKPGEAVCSTDSTSALRAAAKASKAWAESIGTARWLRDGDR